jgi:hypothetical protein
MLIGIITCNASHFLEAQHRAASAISAHHAAAVFREACAGEMRTCLAKVESSVAQSSLAEPAAQRIAVGLGRWMLFVWLRSS